MTRDDLLVLIEGGLDGDLDAVGRQRLGRALADDDAAQELFMTVAADHVRWSIELRHLPPQRVRAWAELACAAAPRPVAADGDGWAGAPRRVPPAGSRNRLSGRRRTPGRTSVAWGSWTAAAAALLLAVAVAAHRAMAPGGDGQWSVSVAACTGPVEQWRHQERMPVGLGRKLMPGDRIATGAEGSVSLSAADGSAVTLLDQGELEVRSAVRPRVSGELFLARGTLDARIGHQPAGTALRFSTPTAEIEVLGTAFRLVADAASTRIAMDEGRVRMTRLVDGAMIVVAAGAEAVAGRGPGPFAAHPRGQPPASPEPDVVPAGPAAHPAPPESSRTEPAAAPTASAAAAPSALVLVDRVSRDTDEGELVLHLRALGFAVTTTAVRDLVAEDLAGQALVVITDVERDSRCPRFLRAAAVPVICCESYWFGALGMTGEGGEDDAVLLRNAPALDIVAPTHPLAAGLRGRVVARPAPASMSSGRPAPAATVVATTDGLPVIFCYATGELMAGSTAPAPRIGFFAHDLGERDQGGRLSEAGWRLFSAAVGWCRLAPGKADPQSGPAP